MPVDDGAPVVGTGAGTRSTSSSVAAESRSLASDAGRCRAARKAATRRFRSPRLAASPAAGVVRDRVLPCRAARSRGRQLAGRGDAARAPRVERGAIGRPLRLASPGQLRDRQGPPERGGLVDGGPGQRLGPHRREPGDGGCAQRLGGPAGQRREPAASLADQPDHVRHRGLGHRVGTQRAPRSARRRRGRRAARRRRRGIVAHPAQRRHGQRDVDREQAAGEMPRRRRSRSSARRACQHRHPRRSTTAQPSPKSWRRSARLARSSGSVSGSAAA